MDNLRRRRRRGNGPSPTPPPPPSPIRAAAVARWAQKEIHQTFHFLWNTFLSTLRAKFFEGIKWGCSESQWGHSLSNPYFWQGPLSWRGREGRERKRATTHPPTHFLCKALFRPCVRTSLSPSHLRLHSYQDEEEEGLRGKWNIIASRCVNKVFSHGISPPHPLRLETKTKTA